MQERSMTTKERLRLTVMEGLAEGRINGTTAADKLDLSVRQVKRLKKLFKEKGHDGLIHGSRGRPGLRKTDINVENTIVRIIKEKYGMIFRGQVSSGEFSNFANLDCPNGEGSLPGYVVVNSPKTPIP